MAPACQLCGCVRGRFRKGITASAHLPVWEKAVPQLLPWCQTLRFLPICHWCLSSCYSGAGAQREWVRISLCTDSLRGTAWDFRIFFHRLNTHWFLQPEVMGTYLLGTGTVIWGSWCGAGTPRSRGKLCLPMLPLWLEVAVLLCKLKIKIIANYLT